MLLPDTVYPRNGLQLERRVEQRLTQEDVARVDEVEAAGVGARMKQECFSGGVFLEISNAVDVVDGGVADAEPSECVA